MNKKIALLTLYTNSNYGNKLQNYAVQETLKKYIKDGEIITIKNYGKINIGVNIKLGVYYLLKEFKDAGIFTVFFQILKKSFYLVIRVIKKTYSKGKKNQFHEKQKVNRINNFMKFDKFIKTSNFIVDSYNPDKKLLQGFDYYVVGSDQVWNTRTGLLNPLFTLGYIKNNSKKIAFSASFGADSLPKGNGKGMKNISKFKDISVRETKGKEIIEEYTDRKDVQVLLDPTMLIPIEAWNKISIKPPQFEKLGYKNDKYIFCYFIGSGGEKIKSEIKRIAEEKCCKIIYIADNNDQFFINQPFYTCGPSEFIWLIRNAYFICTDSFHGSVFSLLYNKPFVVFNRIDPGQKEYEKNSANSRITTLLEKFKIKNRYFSGKIDSELFTPNYPQFESILNQERMKADEFLKQAFHE